MPPLATTVPAAVVPKALSLAAITVSPDAMFRVLAKLLPAAPERMSVPLPERSMLVPVLFETTPENVVVLSTCTVAAAAFVENQLTGPVKVSGLAPLKIRLFAPRAPRERTLVIVAPPAPACTVPKLSCRVFAPADAPLPKTSVPPLVADVPAAPRR